MEWASTTTKLEKPVVNLVASANLVTSWDRLPLQLATPVSRECTTMVLQPAKNVRLANGRPSLKFIPMPNAMAIVPLVNIQMKLGCPMTINANCVPWENGPRELASLPMICANPVQQEHFPPKRGLVPLRTAKVVRQVPSHPKQGLLPIRGAKGAPPVPFHLKQVLLPSCTAKDVKRDVFRKKQAKNQCQRVHFVPRDGTLLKKGLHNVQVAPPVLFLRKLGNNQVIGVSLATLIITTRKLGNNRASIAQVVGTPYF